jgi:uncharacterized membrane protein
MFWVCLSHATILVTPSSTHHRRLEFWHDLFLSLAWLLIVYATPQKMHIHTQHQDQGRWTILTFVVSAAYTSLLAIFFMLKDNQG